MHTLIRRVIVHITHHENLHLRVLSEQTVLHHLGLARTALTIERTRETAWPVAHNHSHVFARHLATHRQETTGLEGRILRQFLHVRHQLHVLHPEERRVVEQRTVDAALIRTLDVAELHVARLQRRLSRKILQHIGILYLGKTDEGTAHVREHIRTHISQGTRHVLQLTRIFHSVPALGRQILIVVLTRIVASIEKILLIIKTHCIHLKLFPSGCSRFFLLSGSTQANNHQQGSQKPYLSSHNF